MAKADKNSESQEVTREVVPVATEQDAMVAGIISGAGEVDEKRWEKIYLDVKSRGNYFDLVRNMYPFRLPKQCKKLQDRKERKYGWIAAENMQIKCDNSKLIYWTPVNKSNHPMIPANMFDRHGGIVREGLYLCYMPWRMYQARCEIQAEMSRIRYEEHTDIIHKENEFASHFDPTDGGTKSASGPGDTVIEEVDVEHPEERFDESGEYVG